MRHLLVRLAEDVERRLIAGAAAAAEEAFAHDRREAARVPALRSLAGETDPVAFAARLAQLLRAQAGLAAAEGDRQPLVAALNLPTRCGTNVLYSLVKALRQRWEEGILAAIADGSLRDLRLLESVVEAAGNVSELTLQGMAAQFPMLGARLRAAFDPEGGAAERTRLRALIGLGGSTDLVREALGRGNTAMRIVALEGAQGLEAEVMALLAGETNESVLRAAVPALAAFGSEEAMRALLRLLDHDDVRGIAQAALTASSHPAAVGLLLEALDADIRMRDEARYASGEFLEKIVKHVRKHHRKETKRWPVEALETIVAAGVRRARKYGLSWESSLTAFVATMFAVGPNFDEHPHVQAILADTSLPPNTKMDVLIKRLGEETWEEVQALRDDKVFDALLAEEAPPAPSEQPEKVWALLKALGRRSDPRIAQGVLRHMDEYGGPPAEAAIESATPDALREIASKLAWDDDEIECDSELHRRCMLEPAVRAAFKLGSAEAFDLLSPVLGDAGESKADLARLDAVVGQLVAASDKRWISLALRMLDRGEALKLRALEAIAKLADAAVSPYLGGLLQIERSIEVRTKVIEVLGALKDPRAIDCLIAARSTAKLVPAIAKAIVSIGAAAIPKLEAEERLPAELERVLKQLRSPQDGRDQEA